MCEPPNKKFKQSFSEAWLTDIRFKSWISRVEENKNLFYCRVCNKSYTCCLSHVLRHADSKSHKIKENKILQPRKSEKRKFRQQWLDIDSFKPWLRKVPHDIYSFSCTFCDKIMAGGLSQIYRHADSALHKERFENNDSETNEYVNNIEESVLSFDERRKAAEIRYAAFIADRNIPYQTAKEILTFFQQIGKDPNILQNMSVGRNKCTNIITNVLCPVETQRVAKSIRNTKFSIFIDETSDISNTKWMTFFVRFVDPDSLEIRSQLVKLININAQNCNAEQLFRAFQNEMYKLQIPFLNIIALSCDNASVMIGKYESFKTKLEKLCKNLLTLSCPCHSAALVAHAACAALPNYCEEFLKKIATYINNSPKRLAIYEDFNACIQETNRKILKLSNTRWLSHYTCFERIIESWDTIKLFLTDMTLNDKSKTGKDLLTMMQNIDLKAYFLFLYNVLDFFNTFNAFFQSQETRIHLLQPKSVKFLTIICEHFIRKDLLKNICDNFDFSKKENQKSLAEISLGFDCEEYLNMINEEHADVVKNVRENCLQFYVAAAENISKRLPNDKFLSKLKVFKANIALFDSNRESSFNDVSFIAQILGGFDQNALKKEWFILYLDFSEKEKNDLSKLTFDNMWIKILQRQYPINNDKYQNLKSLLNAVRSLPNSNADPERIFSLLTDVKTKKRNSLSSENINAICVVKTALKARRETIFNMEINSEHLSLMTSDNLYKNNPEKKTSSTFTSHASENVDFAGPSDCI